MPPPELPRATERRNPRSQDLDTRSPAQLVDLFLAEDAMVPAAVAGARDAIVATLERIEAAFRAGGRLFYVGAGTSGRLGVLDASECPPTFGTDPTMVQGLIAGGNAALTQAVEGAEDDAGAGGDALDARGLTSRDVVVGIAASGATPYVAGALARARGLGATAVLLTCATPPADLVAVCDEVIHVDTGPELVTGSTRLKAGTATKLVLNQLTTGAMVRLGKTYGHLMVDLQARNAKLRDRGERIIVEVVGGTHEAAREAIAAAGGSVRTAIVMRHLGVSRAEAERALEVADRRLRDILGPPPAMEGA